MTKSGRRSSNRHRCHNQKGDAKTYPVTYVPRCPSVYAPTNQAIAMSIITERSNFDGSYLSRIARGNPREMALSTLDKKK